ncbi:MAG TPA: hypothetical protein VGL59_04930 [Polyangia bacterium]|jgi:hypothetical protein
MYGSWAGRGARSGILLCLVLLAPALSVQARAAGPAGHVRVVGAGACPAAVAVARELQKMLPALDVTPSTDGGDPGDAFVVEDPSGLRVTVGGAQRAFTDAAADCPARARFAAIFIALVLYPPQLPPLGAPPSPTPAASPRTAVEVEGGPALQFAPGSGQSSPPVALGGGARLTVGRLLRLSAGVSVLSSTFHFARADADALWVPLDLGLRFLEGAGPYQAGAEASAVLIPLRLQGRALMSTETGWRFAVGGRLAVFARRWLTRSVGLVASLDGDVWPGIVQLSVAGVGTVGNTPRLWLGGQLAAVIRLR